MQYLGRIAGSGLLMRDGDAVARTSYDFEGFARQRGVVVSSGEINLAPSDLKTVFGRLNVQLLTDDGRLLDLKFTDKELRHASDVAQVEVFGDLPGSSAEWRGEAAPTPTSASPAPTPTTAPSRSKTPAPHSQRQRGVSA